MVPLTTENSFVGLQCKLGIDPPRDKTKKSPKIKNNVACNMTVFVSHSEKNGGPQRYFMPESDRIQCKF